MIDEINDLLEALNDPRHTGATGAERRVWLERKVRVLEELAERSTGPTLSHAERFGPRPAQRAND